VIPYVGFGFLDAFLKIQIEVLFSNLSISANPAVLSEMENLIVRGNKVLQKRDSVEIIFALFFVNWLFLSKPYCL